MKLVVNLSVVTLLVGLSGCAAEYHQYPCGCVPYGYFPPAPLPYAGYDVCPTPVSARYLDVGTGMAESLVLDQAE